MNLAPHRPLIAAGVLILVVVLISFGGVFFIRTILNDQKKTNIALPPFGGAERAPREALPLIYIDSAGAIRWDDQPIELNDLKNRLADSGMRRVCITASRKLDYQRMKDILLDLRTVGITNVGLSVVENE